MTPVTEETYSQIVREYWGAVRLNRYYTALCRQYRWWRNLLQVVLLLIPAGGLLTAFEQLYPPRWAIVAASLAIVFLVCIANTWQLSRKTAVLEVVSHECTRLETEWNSLLLDVRNYSIAEKTARERNRQLMNQLDAWTDRSAQAGIKEDLKLNEQCQIDAKTIVEQSWNTPTATSLGEGQA